MATSLGTISATFTANASPFVSAASQVRTAVSSTTSEMTRAQSAHRSFGSSLLGAVSGFGQWVFWGKQAVSTVTGFVGSLFSQNAAMEQTRIGFVGLLGGASQADAMLRRLQTFAASTPFEFPELAKDTQMLLGMGFAAQDIIPTMTAVGDAVAGVGAGSDGIQRAVIALGQMQARGKVTADDMMQLTELGIPAWRLLAQQMGLTTAQVQDLSQKGLLPADTAIRQLTAGMERMYGGQMKNQATTFNGLISTMKDNLNMAWQAFLTPAFNAARTGLQALVTLLSSPAVMQFATNLGQAVGTAISTVATGVTRLIGFFQSLSLAISAVSGPSRAASNDMSGWGQAMNTLGLIIGQVSNILSATFGPALMVIRNNLAPLGAAIMNVVSALGTALAGAFRSASAAMVGLNITPLAQGLAQLAQVIMSGLIGGLNTLATALRSGEVSLNAFTMPLTGIRIAFTSLSPVLIAFGSVFTTQIVPALQSCVTPMMSMIAATNRVRDAIMQAVAQYLPAFGVALGGLVTAIGPVVADFIRFAGVITGVLAQALSAIAPVIGQAAGALISFATEIITRVTPAITSIRNEIASFLAWLAPIWNAVWPSLLVLIQGVWQGIQGFIQVAFAIITGVIKVGLDLISGNWRQAWTDIQTMVANIWTGIQNIIGGMIGVIRGLIGGFITGVIALFQQLYAALVGGSIIPDLVNGAIRWFTTMSTSLSSLTTALMGTLTGTWNTIVTTITGIVTRMISNLTGMFARLGPAILAPFQQAAGALGGIVRGMGNAAIGAFNGILGGLQSFLSMFANAINSIASAVGAGSRIGAPGIGRVAYLAQGTDRWPGGAAVVGEQGPELVYLPAGSAVIPARQTALMRQNGVVPGLQGGVGLMDVINWMAGGAASVFNNVFHATLNFPGIFAGVASSVMGMVRQWGVDMVGRLLGNITASIGSVFGGAGGGAAPGNVTSWLLAAIAATGVPVSWLGALTTIAMHESGGNPNDINTWDINAQRGTPSIGLMQTIGPTFAAYAMAGHGNIYNPVDNAIAAIRYILSRYGSVFNVPGIVSMSRGGPYVGYANGGLIAEEIVGVGTRSGNRYLFGEKGPEYVTPAGGTAGGRPILVQVLLNSRVLAEQLMPAVMDEVQLVMGPAAVGGGMMRWR